MVPPDVTLGVHDILIVGQNPGADEERIGKPFQGKSGQLLKGWLKRLGILDRCGFANACFYHAPEGNRKPTKQEITGCYPILMRTILSMKPKLIICTGDVPARVFGFKGSVGSMVGKFKIETRTDEPITITVVYHPAYGIRLKGSKRFGEVEAQTLEVIQEALHRISSTREVESYNWVKVESITPLPSLAACDTEHMGSRDPRLAELTSVQVYNGSGPVQMGPSLLAAPHQPLLFHNAVHDLIVLERHGMKQEVCAGDSMVAAAMLGRQNISLKGLAWRELGANVIDFEEADAAGGEVWDNYCAQDPVLTYRLHEKLYAELQSKGIAWLYDNVEMPLQPLLAEMSLYGLEVDHERVMALWSAMDRRVEILAEAIRAECGPDFNPDSPTQVLKYCREQLGLRITNTDEDALSGIRNAPLFITHLLAYRKAKKRISTYLQPMSDMKIMSGIFNPVVSTGRLSQTKRNLQNLPGDIKRCLRAPEGYVFIYRDYSQIEVRKAAYYSRDEYLLGALREGRNIHEELCIKVYGYRIPELYTKAKSANFERLYGGSLGTRAEKLGVSERFLAQREVPWVQFEEWANQQRVNARRHGEAWTYMGRRMLLHGIDSSDKKARDDAERQAINMPEQGGAADIVKNAMNIAKPWYAELGGRIGHQEHDSILGIAPERLAQEADRALDEAMTEAVPEEIRKVIDFPSKSVISTHWG